MDEYQNITSYLGVAVRFFFFLTLFLFFLFSAATYLHSAEQYSTFLMTSSLILSAAYSVLALIYLILLIIDAVRGEGFSYVKMIFTVISLPIALLILTVTSGTTMI